ncbi:MAG: hypothetical protein ACYCZX_01330 [Rhodospirillaceae bacterium]
MDAMSPDLTSTERSAGQNAIRQRCAACQLQLCKSRGEPPHAALKEGAVKVTGGKFAGGDTVYVCDTCGTTLVRSDDPGKAGWSQRRQ